MSETRPPARSVQQELPPDELDELDELEELGDEAIISQQTAPHPLQPRANVSEESRSVVITEHPAPVPAERRGSEPARHPPPRSSAEATLVIRDRRALDEMRQKIVRRQEQRRARSRNALYLWGALGLAAFVLGGVVAFLATDTGLESQTADNQLPATRGEAPRALPSTPPGMPATQGSAPSPARPVPLHELPVEPPRQH